ncbi:MAG: hypothetical protein LBK66_03065 [Spirochaetaceae bacterium]|jgi:hypothetical protein|nr:hypothetical protein [Spirochaetaceae bacterium]
MLKTDMIHFLEKYKKICFILNLPDDIRSFDELISFVGTNDRRQDSEKPNIKSTNEECFYAITSVEGVDLSKYNINYEIINNRTNMLNYWSKLNADAKEKFNVFELNLIMYFLTKSNSYIKKKK